ncbi:hypothetical protein PTE31013_03752 [Pandoraea terrigena]|uniref:Uncharacterized protein n=1 Tax=Pandoraea terrigena TaxID=2508292 RepID=A0A5E4X8H3_9BURK|nr:hypothetical protein PTE31013_03752 [Pandoraea terrigena]
MGGFAGGTGDCHVTSRRTSGIGGLLSFCTAAVPGRSSPSSLPEAAWHRNVRPNQGARKLSRRPMNEPMTQIVDGVAMLIAAIRSAPGGKFPLQIPKEKARLLFQRVLAKAGPVT